MIRFPCRCGHLFEEPDDAANSAVQCPACHLLVDVPSLSDMQSIGLDGTYLVDSTASRPAPDQLADTLQLFTPGKTDAAGEPIDLRTQGEDLDPVGDYDTIEQAQRRQRPRYDPETGELVKPIPIMADAPTAPIPFAKPAITYEASGTIQPRNAAQVLLDLVRPLNLLVFFFVVVIHGLAIASTAVLLMGLFIIAPILAALLIGILAHYANVIDEIGVEEQNELPRVMRDMRMHEDVFWPFARVLTALVLCYGPAVGALFLPGDRSFVSSLAVTLALLGTIFFPAIILTLQTSGSIANLRPDRVFSVMSQSGTRYITTVLLFMMAMVPYLAALFSLCVLAGFTSITAGVPGWFGKLSISLPLLCIGIFMMHAFCWELGLIYRADSERFPWVGRYHVREKRELVVRRKPRYATGESTPNPTLLAAERQKTFREPRTR